MRFIMLPIVVAIVALSSCVQPLDEDNQPAPTEQRWTDQDEGSPNYPTTNENMDWARGAFDYMTAADQRETCNQFWEYSDDEIYESWADDGFTNSEINAVLNTLWEVC